MQDTNPTHYQQYGSGKYHNHTNQSQHSFSRLLYFLILLLLTAGLIWLTWKYSQMVQKVNRLTNQVELAHQRLPLADQITEQNQFEQSIKDRIDQVEARFSKIMHSSNEVITMVEHLTNLDITREVEHLQKLIRINIDKLDKLEQQMQFISSQQENMMYNQSNIQLNEQMNNARQLQLEKLEQELEVMRNK